MSHLRRMEISIEERTENFTAAASGASTELRFATSSLSLQVVGVGAAPTAWSVSLQGSNNNANWTNLLMHITADGNGANVFTGSNRFPIRYVRVNVTALVLGGATSINVLWRASV